MSNSDGFLTLLAEDNALIVYRKSLKQITNSVTATILLQQIIHRFKSKKRIYKFKAPCDHERYRPGDSWTEELGVSTKEFDTAIKKIGTKLSKGLKKEDVLGRWEANALVIYWIDRGRVTWYELNRPLLNAYLSVIYLNTQRAFRKVTRGELLIYLPKGYLHDLPESPPESPHSPKRDFLNDFQDDVVASIGRHTDQEMLGSTGGPAKSPPLMVGSTLVAREIVHQILKLRQEGWSFKQISEKLSIPVELVNDIFIKHRFYSNTKIVSTNVRVKTVDEVESGDYEPESCTCAVMAATGGMPSCSYCENSTDEVEAALMTVEERNAVSDDSNSCAVLSAKDMGVDEVEKAFGPNPRQIEIDAYQPGELSRGELVLAKLGSVDGSTRHYVKRIKDSGWNIRDEDVELGLAAFAMVTGFALPTTKAQRKLWETGIREHLAEELFKGHLRVLYDKVWDKIQNDVFEGKLTITHPKALTQWMYQEINAEARPTPLTRAQITSRLVDSGLVELREFDGDRVDYVWAATGQSVSEMSETFLKEQIG